MSATVSFTGVVLTGGSSSRLGTDKCFVEVEGRPMAAIARDALRAAGAGEVLAIGGDDARLRRLGFRVVPDTWPGEGPLSAIIDALAAASAPIAVVLACDQPAVDAELVTLLLGSLGEDDDAAVPVVDGVPQPLVAAYRTRAVAELREAFGAGERSPRRALVGLRWHVLDGIDAARVADVDDRDDLARYAAADPMSRTIADPDQSLEEQR